MIRSWLAPKPVDRPVLAGIVIDPLFREYITLTPYIGRKHYGKQEKSGSRYADHDGFMIGNNTFAGIRKWEKGQIETSILEDMKYTVG